MEKGEKLEPMEEVTVEVSSIANANFLCYVFFHRCGIQICKC